VKHNTLSVKYQIFAGLANASSSVPDENDKLKYCQEIHEMYSAVPQLPDRYESLYVEPIWKLCENPDFSKDDVIEYLRNTFTGNQRYNFKTCRYMYYVLISYNTVISVICLI